MEFRGLNVDFDLYDAECAEKYEAELLKVKTEATEIPGETLPVMIRRVCNKVFSFFDAICGEGFHKKLFGEKTNMAEALEAFAEFNIEVAKQKDSFNQMVNKYTPNRAARRAAGGKK